MGDQNYIDVLNAELIAKAGMLIDLESGALNHGGSLESRGLGFRQRMLRIRAQIDHLSAPQTMPGDFAK